MAVCVSCSDEGISTVYAAGVGKMPEGAISLYEVKCSGKVLKLTSAAFNYSAD